MDLSPLSRADEPAEGALLFRVEAGNRLLHAPATICRGAIKRVGVKFWKKSFDMYILRLQKTLPWLTISGRAEEPASATFSMKEIANA
jgi:hypothetical protein